MGKQRGLRYPRDRATETMSIKVAIVEDNTVVRESLALILDGSPGFQCVSACRTGEEALKKIPIHAPNVILMDINLPEMSGIDCVRQLKERLPTAQIVML